MNILLFAVPAQLLGIKGWEWIILLVLVLLLFGGKKIPELMKGLGKGVKSFKEGVNEAKEELKDVKKDLETPSEEKKKEE